MSYNPPVTFVTDFCFKIIYVDSFLFGALSLFCHKSAYGLNSGCAEYKCCFMRELDRKNTIRSWISIILGKQL